MKLTTQKLKKLIIEELNEMDHVAEQEKEFSSKMSIQDKILLEEAFEIINKLQQKFDLRTNRALAEKLSKAMDNVKELMAKN